MEKEMSEKMENLRWKVLEKGQKTRDKAKIALGVIEKTPDGILKLQMLKDFQKSYKFYDALTMWLGQSQYWSDSENDYLVSLAETYLNESDCNRGQGKMKKLFCPFLKNDQRINKEPTQERKLYQDDKGNELWVRIYKQADGFCLATDLSRFPELGYEVEMKYDWGHPPAGVDPVEICAQAMLEEWGVDSFFIIAKGIINREKGGK